MGSIAFREILITGILRTRTEEERVRLEGYGEAELERMLGMGYSADSRLAAPAVMDLVSACDLQEIPRKYGH